MSDLSIILRCKNEERWIGHTIQSCLDLIINPEIIVIDNNSTDSSLSIVRLFAHDPSLPESRGYTNVKIYNIDNYTPGKALNLAAKNATSKFLLIISSHCVLTSFDLQMMKKDIKNYCCIFGKQTPFYNGKRIEKRYIWSHFKEKREVNMYSSQEDRYFMHNALSFFEKETLITNPFNENLQGKEDRYWAISMIKNGSSILYEPNFSCNHHYTDAGNTWKGIG